MTEPTYRMPEPMKRKILSLCNDWEVHNPDAVVASLRERRQSERRQYDRRLRERRVAS